MNLAASFRSLWQYLEMRKMTAAFDHNVRAAYHLCPGLGIVMKPGIHHRMTGHPDFEFTYRTVALGEEPIGIRETDLPRDPYGLVLGDSMINGYGAEDADTFVRIFEKSDGRRYLNLGQCHFSTHQYLESFRRAKKYFRPKVALAFVFQNDFEERLEMRDLGGLRERPVSAAQRINSFLLRESLLYRLLRAPDIHFRERTEQERTAAAQGKRKVHVPYKDIVLTPFVREGEVVFFETDKPEWAESLRLMREDFAGLKNEAEGVPSRLFVFYIPSKEQAYLHLLERKFKVRADWDAGAKAVGEICRGLDLPFFDLTGAFQKQAGMGRVLYWRVDGHWNRAGNELTAQAVRDRLAGLLP